MLQWNENFETGDPVIDSQHKTLISYINRLEGLFHTPNFDRQEAEFVLNLVDFIVIYTNAHFKHEEDCMARYKCPVYQENKGEHSKFLEHFRSFKGRIESEGCRPAILQELHNACSVWIERHIMQIDTHLKPCLSQTPPPEE